jgi:GNAT superfamily N-acetyltransferase
VEPRPYQASDRDACLAVFDSTAVDGRDEFEHFLDSGYAANCTVLDHDGSILGCGGFSIENGVATLKHGMIRRDMRKMGLGRFLLMYRLRQITNSGTPVQFAKGRTTAQSAPFFEKQGFKVQRSHDGVVDLLMKLTVCP